MEGTRPATRDDAPRCGELCRQAVAELAGARGGPLWMRGETGLVAKALMRPGGLDRLLADARRRVVVGTVDGVVVGVAVGRVEAVGEAPVGVVDGCYVEPGARGVGVGGALLEDLVGWLDAGGCRGVDASALPGDRATKSLLESSGFKARLITLHRSLR
ncbi:MAG TPA: GNAT family N-acetyltransferase [Acidimicrobiales bacterium]|nr:GNAT family N-acetyltransferase [Acidimicrobiales bacterium]